ncbi:glycosyl transferase [Candidatus Woesearchaeota archaeon CG08_land_8_20_14_0_20_43_7]|nr:MAG: glycosyl transferase [Candidatus Woesearchaeota archaeon CG08_land_8_20_14_0_20_43_7]
MNHKLSVLIPAYNESSTIKELIEKVKKVPLRRYGIDMEIIVVDDGSKDDTVDIVKKIAGVKLVKHKKNRGKGAAIRTAIEYATGDITIIQDADLEYDPKDYPMLIKPIIDGETKVVYGSRALQEVQKSANKRFLKSKNENAYHAFYLGGKALTVISNILFNAKITDEPTCYKVFDTKLLKGLDLKCERFEFCPEVTAKVCKRGYKIKELPIRYYPRGFEEGKKIKFRDGIEAVWTLLKYRFVD